MVSSRHGSGADEARQNETAEIVQELRECTDEAERIRLRERLVVVNVPVATSIALRYRSRGEAMEDLVQAAHLGLVKAVNGFVPELGRDFLAYAVPTISGEVKRHFRDQGWDIRPPRRIQELRAEVERASADLTQSLGRAPRLSEIAAHLGASEDDVVECVATAEHHPDDDIIAELIVDHREVDEMLTTLQGEMSAEDRQDTMEQVISELIRH